MGTPLGNPRGIPLRMLFMILGAATEAPARTTAQGARRVVGGARLIVGLGLLATIAIQVTDRVANGSFDPAEYFSYFTIESSLMNIVVLLVGAALAVRFSPDTVLYTTIRMSVLAYAVVTAGVYNLLLRNVPYDGFVGLTWPNEIIHVWVPMFLLLDWLFSPGRPALPWTSLRVVLLYPVAWIVYTLIRGAVTGYYPYPFLDPANGGWGSVAAYVVGLSAFLVGIGALAVLYSRRRTPRL